MRRAWTILAAVALAVVGLDQLTKALVRSQLAPGESVELVGPLSIHRTANSGVAFSLFAGGGALVSAGVAALLVVLVVVAARMLGRHPLLAPAFGLLVGGAAGNLLDRLRLGQVTDFIDIGPWPPFNVADSSITLGAAFAVLALMAGERRQ